MKLRPAILAALWLGAVWPAAAPAESRGIFDQARPGSQGCYCHANPGSGTPLENPSALVNVILTIDGQPLQAFPGWAPGESYDLSVWVLGPTPGLSGFNLDVSAGRLEPKDDTSQVRHLTECGRVRADTFPRCTPGEAGNDCGVLEDPGCPVYERFDPDCQRCATVGGTCRACDDVTFVDAQATHVASPLPAGNGKPVPTWDLVWTAPDDSVAEVEFHAAGNDVSGEGNTGLDFWNFLSPNPITIPRR